MSNRAASNFHICYKRGYIEQTTPNLKNVKFSATPLKVGPQGFSRMAIAMVKFVFFVKVTERSRFDLEMTFGDFLQIEPNRLGNGV